MEQGTLFIKLSSAEGAYPVPGSIVISQTENGVRVFEQSIEAGADGLAPVVTLNTPDRSISLDPQSTQLPYAAYDVEVSAAQYAPVLIEGVQVYSGVEAYLPINMVPIFSSADLSPDAFTSDTRSLSGASSQQMLHYTIPQPALTAASSSGPQPRGVCSSQPFVLDQVFIPEYITVHLGKPQSYNANETVSFPYYIKNVCSSEIYPTWPENALRANIYAQISLALNRIFTEWYPSKGYSFNITNSTQYDQYYVSGRNIFTNISRLVDEIFNTYLRRMGDFAPYYAEYCNGTTVTCSGMSQWGTVSLANQGLTPIQILRRYYGNNFELVTTTDIRSIPSSYPGTPLRIGSTGNSVRIMQRQLNRIRKNYPNLPLLSLDGVFGADTENAVKIFQRQFNLSADGVVGKKTWYKISYIYVSVKKLAELVSESEPYPDNSGNSSGSGTGTLREGATGSEVASVQYYLSYLARTFYPSIPNITPDGIFGADTTSAVRAFQRTFGLSVDGIVGPATWAALEKQFEIAYDDNNPNSYFGAYPGLVLREGSRGLRVQQMQFYLLSVHYSYSSIPRIRADGIYGPNTTAAVRAFQRTFGLSADGAVGLITWTELYSIYSQQNARILNYDEIPAYPNRILSNGSVGRSVLGVQTYLNIISRKYGSISPSTRSGLYRSRTTSSVRLFQREFSLPETGRVDAPTWARIYSEYQKTLAGETQQARFIDVSYPGCPVELGTTNIFVSIALYYYNMIAAFDSLLRPVPITETFDLEDRAAIQEFQRTRGIPTTGTIDAETWDVLYSQYYAVYRILFPDFTVSGRVAAPYQTLYPGSSGIAVEQLQVMLNTLSAYYCDVMPEDVSGIYTETTESNVFILQQALGLEPTGETDPRTWQAISAVYDSITHARCGGSEAQGDLYTVQYPCRTIDMINGITRMITCPQETVCTQPQDAGDSACFTDCL